MLPQIHFVQVSPFNYLKKQQQDLIVCLGASGLSCTMPDFHCVVWDLLLGWTDSLVVASRFSCSVACGILVP